ncbi:Protein-tyrosine phosphatase, receptor/non-receptor type domain and Protein-tyrosine/Dual specificity phosphatase domain and Protein-tyrosine phosphatase, catalytic domain-containing protein [Strongyloides ratti]|uniref:Protein-tyrosine phosphatase, receptor/non-receptor type domain and Protein-tyrosine/Dual specificity phosphatase domain and Protein-tyrosine phosphatase, catalytic domain-containing protein n=1 Tax=Strongyloides ratti TaxID=34506 RepID=A0A090L6L1_STRRB|nr:Protein-tyrosine phosphatase, receptor/non-receptor type domain and Protein-tyrosine/Dual specificity phosphatase domain and Protein-tyrosine phosphatase, catalytic domain-containing protein [Strongyloides ratti]CEF63134.1 Protein-tyrosine phosphatase, receptor/non-receptor type domain and Protein-tyrosine/Dual specificity phosphatase domain and Protein-tyrosine phosphatase, catalytic domain-containing protein [Strongyloides ratti]
MFLDLNKFKNLWLLLLLPSFTQCETGTYKSSFPSVPEDIIESTFPVNLTFASNSDLIFLKCPGYGYKHTHDNDHFNFNYELSRQDFSYRDNDRLFYWIFSIYNPSGPQLFDCGSIRKRPTSNSYTSFDWKFNINWQIAPNPMMIAKRINMSNQFPTIDNCGSNQENIFMYTRDRDGKIFRLKLVNNSLDTYDERPYANRLYYVFTMPDDINNKEYLEPCMIVNPSNDRPEIIIRGYSSYPVFFKNIQVNVIQLNYVEHSCTVQLYIIDKPKLEWFYRDEKILVNEVIFTKDGVKEVLNSNKTVKQYFTLKEHRILKFSYDWPTAEGYQTITKIFYFAPPKEEHEFNIEYFFYLANETVLKPNCSINGISYGYLYSVGYEGKIINLDELKTNGVAKNGLFRSGDFVFTSNVEYFNITLKCIYKTVNGSVTFIKSFLHKDKVSMQIDENGKRYLLVDTSKLNPQTSQHETLNIGPGLIILFCIVGVIVLFGLIIVIVIFVIILNTKMKPYIIRRKLASKYPNIFALWKEVSNANLEEYCKIVQDKEFIPDKLKNQSSSKKIEGDEEIDFDTSAPFDSSLVKCFNTIFGEIRAHYINDVSPERNYIISDGPTPERIQYFWELLYQEDVAVVVAIIYRDAEEYSNMKKNILYWSETDQIYGNVTVQFLEKLPTKIKNIKVLKFRMTMNGGKPKELIIFRISEWSEYILHHMSLNFAKVYSEVSECAGNGNVLVHALRSPGSYVFMFTYFCCILETMKTNASIYNPMEIIKQIREKRYGGNISSIEYAYLLEAIISYFFDSNILFNKNCEKQTFTMKFLKYRKEVTVNSDNMTSGLYGVLKYINTLDDGKLNEFCVQFDTVGMLSYNSLKKNCRRFFIAKESFKEKNRYNDIPCLDYSSVNINGYDINNVLGYIHANQMVYKYGEGKERKIIMCQAPLSETVDDMYDMIFRYKIGIIVVLLNEKEIKEQNKCFPYFPTDAKEIKTSRYTVMYIDKKIDNVNHIIEYDYTIFNDKNLPNNFKLLQYINWPDKSIPTESKTINELYKRIINLDNNRYIAIHCSTGIGRTGTLALAIFMIDMINFNENIDPIACLEFLRSHRYKAVQTKMQFIFSLSIVYEHFRDAIDAMKTDAYKTFTTFAKNIYLHRKQYKG